MQRLFSFKMEGILSFIAVLYNQTKIVSKVKIFTLGM